MISSAEALFYIKMCPHFLIEIVSVWFEKEMTSMSWNVITMYDTSRVCIERKSFSDRGDMCDLAFIAEK